VRSTAERVRRKRDTPYAETRRRGDARSCALRHRSVRCAARRAAGSESSEDPSPISTPVRLGSSLTLTANVAGRRPAAADRGGAQRSARGTIQVPLCVSVPPRLCGECCPVPSVTSESPSLILRLRRSGFAAKAGRSRGPLAAARSLTPVSRVPVCQIRSSRDRSLLTQVRPAYRRSHPPFRPGSARRAARGASSRRRTDRC